MTVGAISSNAYNYSTIEYNYFGTTISNSRLEDLMKQYGLNPTGDPDIDIKALYQAMHSSASSTISKAQAAADEQANSQTTAALNSMNAPWATLMSQIGLYATGDFDTDFQSFNDRISAMSVNANSQQDKAAINQLQAQASIVFVPQTQTTQNTAQASSQSFSGADITAQMNRLFIVGA